MCCDVFINHEDTKNFSGVRTQESGVRRKGRDFFHHEEIEGHEDRCIYLLDGRCARC
jgi:hypothetical protein